MDDAVRKKKSADREEYHPKAKAGLHSGDWLHVALLPYAGLSPGGLWDLWPIKFYGADN
jgi:hypothetical protein